MTLYSMRSHIMGSVTCSSDHQLVQKSDYTQEPEKMKTQEYPYCLEEKHQIGLGQITLVAT